MKTRIKVESVVIGGIVKEFYTAQFKDGFYGWKELDILYNDWSRITGEYGKNTLASAQKMIDFVIEAQAIKQAVENSRKITYIGYP